MVRSDVHNNAEKLDTLIAEGSAALEPKSPGWGIGNVTGVPQDFSVERLRNRFTDVDRINQNLRDALKERKDHLQQSLQKMQDVLSKKNQAQDDIPKQLERQLDSVVSRYLACRI